MARKIRFLIINFFIIASISNIAWSYIVKKGDTLSSIAKKNIFKKVYGQNGSLKKILALNPHIVNDHFIKPGQNIVISESNIIDLPKSAAITDAAYESKSYVINNVKNVERSPQEVPTERSSSFTSSFRRRASLAITPYYSMTALSSKDNNSGSEDIVSSLYNTGVTGSYIQEWSKGFQSAVNLKMGMIAFENPSNSVKTLLDKHKFISGLGLETNHALNEKLHLKLSAEYGKELFIRSASTRSTAVDAINITSLGFKAYYEIQNLDPFVVGVAASYAAKMPAKNEDLDLKLGHEFGANLYLIQFTGSANDSKFQTELGITHRQQNTNSSSQIETSINIGIRFFFSIGNHQ